MDLEQMIEKLSVNFGNNWQDYYYFLMEKGYSHSEAICYTYNKFFVENGK